MPTKSQPPWQPPAIAPLDPDLLGQMRARIDGKAKPPGSLGRIEDLSVQLGMIAHPAAPRADNAVLLVFAGDHGLTEEGVSQYPSAVTVAMVKTDPSRPRQRQCVCHRQPCRHSRHRCRGRRVTRRPIPT